MIPLLLAVQLALPHPAACGPQPMAAIPTCSAATPAGTTCVMPDNALKVPITDEHNVAVVYGWALILPPVNFDMGIRTLGSSTLREFTITIDAVYGECIDGQSVGPLTYTHFSGGGSADCVRRGSPVVP